MYTIVFASKNNKKLQEVNTILEGTDYKVISMEAAGIKLDVEEDGKTYEENAIKKATAIMKLTGATVMADDSGLEIDFLNKAPGIKSARFGGYKTSYLIKNKLILDCLKDVPYTERRARFVCAIALVFSNGRLEVKRGEMEGYIHTKQVGRFGFGYDPIFFLPEYNKTVAEIAVSEKNKISHRAKALMQIKELLECTKF